MNQQSFNNIIVLVINLIGIVIIGEKDKAYCGCAVAVQ